MNYITRQNILLRLTSPDTNFVLYAAKALYESYSAPQAILRGGSLIWASNRRGFERALSMRRLEGLVQGAVEPDMEKKGLVRGFFMQ